MTQGTQMKPQRRKNSKKRLLCPPESNTTCSLTNTQLTQSAKNKHSQSSHTYSCSRAERLRCSKHLESYVSPHWTVFVFSRFFGVAAPATAQVQHDLLSSFSQLLLTVKTSYFRWAAIRSLLQRTFSSP